MKLFLLAAVCLFGAPVFGQVSTADGLKVNGVGLGATYETVLTKFGKPVKVFNREAEPCVGGQERNLHYNGAWFRFHDDPMNPKDFTLSQFEVYSAKHDVMGMRIGATRAAVLARFGKAAVEDTDPETGARVLSYFINDEIGGGSSSFYFKNGKVSKITSVYLLC